MYSTCLFCNKDLGENQVLEEFPVGKRIAFDAARGRLWVVCRSCERWNLSPLDERWEAIEAAEHQYHGTRRRVATEHIGLARLGDGTELVRIGEPLRPEFAGWRYGDQFGRRRNRRLLYAGAGVTAIGAGIIGGAAAGITIGAFGGVLYQFVAGAIHGSDEEVVARVRLENKGTVKVRRRHLAETRIVQGTDAPIALELRYKDGESLVEGAEALRVAGLLMPHVNRFGGKRDVVDASVAAIEERGGSEGFIEHLARIAPSATRVETNRKGKRKPKKTQTGAFKSGLFGLTHPTRLALEMALHEEAERRALHGQLAELERAWREAEEIAGIADDLTLPSRVRTAFDKLRERASSVT